MISAESAISRCRRDLTMGSLLKWLLIGGSAAVFLLGPLLGGSLNGTLLLVGIFALWLMLSYRSVKGSRLAADSPALIAAGQFEQAEHHIDQALRSFSIFRTVKLVSLHHLAVLRHAQRRWPESARLCQALLGQRLGSLQGLSKSSRLILADAMLEMGDLRGTHHALSGLYNHRLTLGEAMNLLRVQLDYLSRVGAWEQMMSEAVKKAQMAELMATADSVKTQALLALAAKKTGRSDWADWFRRRVELLADPRDLVSARPALREVWPVAMPEGNC